MFLALLCISLSQHATVAMDRDNAIVVYAQWKNVNSTSQISLANAFLVSKAVFSAKNLPPLSKADFEFIIDDLAKLKCVRVKGSMVKLIEKVTF